MEHDDDFFVHLEVNNNTSFRDRVGAFLRKLARKIDGRLNLALRVTANPVIDGRAAGKCIQIGLNTMRECLFDEVRSVAVERFMERELPHLYGKKEV